MNEKYEKTSELITAYCFRHETALFYCATREAARARQAELGCNSEIQEVQVAAQSPEASCMKDGFAIATPDDPIYQEPVQIIFRSFPSPRTAEGKEKPDHDQPGRSA